jgi:hypothetical protein
MEADISILLKPGHFYFALTRVESLCRRKMRMAGLCKVEMSTSMDESLTIAHSAWLDIMRT